MKILLINSSVRNNAASLRALLEIKNEILTEGADALEYNIGATARHCCSACGGCRDMNRCVYGDIDSLTELCERSQAIILCTPTHYASAPGNLTAVLSRLLFSSKRSVANKPIGICGVGRRAGILEAIQDVRKFFEFAACPIISGVYPSVLYAKEYESASYDEEGLQNMRSLARHVIYIARCIELGYKNGITPPSEEERVYTDISSVSR